MIEFPTKSSYLNWRLKKRIEFAVVSEMLRKSKAALRSDVVRAASRNVEAERKTAFAEQRVPKWKRLRANTSVIQNHRIALKSQATAILKERAEAKVIARESWTKWKESNEA